MHRIDGPGATEDNRFTEGSPTLGIPPTMVTADWANALQEEIIAVIAQAGFTLDKAYNGQLKDAIEALIAESFPGIASDVVAGLVKVGDGLAINGSGVLSATLSGSSSPSANAIVKALASGKIDSGWLDIAQSLDSSGYIMLPQGSDGGKILLQWGKVSFSASSNDGVQTVTYPIAFPSEVFGVLATRKNAVAGTSSWTADAQSISNAQATIVANGASGVVSNSVDIFWLAIGR